MDDATCEGKRPQLATWIDRLGSSLKRANEIEQQLRDRLNPLLKSGSKEPAVIEASPAESLVPLATDIRGHVWDLDRLSDKYEEMIGLIEL